uniref:Uncharacterized protein n=1 Tax=Helianthus annuus TaxID=4232 RepID=A0A251TXN8_HELAN
MVFNFVIKPNHTTAYLTPIFPICCSNSPSHNPPLLDILIPPTILHSFSPSAIHTILHLHFLNLRFFFSLHNFIFCYIYLMFTCIYIHCMYICV